MEYSILFPEVKIIKIDQEMQELWSKMKWHLFYPDTVYILIGQF